MAEEKKTTKKKAPAPKKADPKKAAPRANSLTEGQAVTHPDGRTGSVSSVENDSKGNQWVWVSWNDGSSSSEYSVILSS
jgi:hypothetical protein